MNLSQIVVHHFRFFHFSFDVYFFFCTWCHLKEEKFKIESDYLLFEVIKIHLLPFSVSRLSRDTSIFFFLSAITNKIVN